MNRRNNAPRNPDFLVRCADRETGREGNIGVAWKNPDGSVGIRLNFCTLIDTAQSDLIITLVPNGNGH